MCVQMDVEGGEDLRLDERVEQLFGVMVNFCIAITETHIALAE